MITANSNNEKMRIPVRFLGFSERPGDLGLGDAIESLGAPHCGQRKTLSEICFLHFGHSIKGILAPFSGSKFERIALWAIYRCNIRLFQKLINKYFSKLSSEAEGVGLHY